MEGSRDMDFQRVAVLHGTGQVSQSTKGAAERSAVQHVELEGCLKPTPSQRGLLVFSHLPKGGEYLPTLFFCFCRHYFFFFFFGPRPSPL